MTVQDSVSGQKCLLMVYEYQHYGSRLMARSFAYIYLIKQVAGAFNAYSSLQSHMQSLETSLVNLAV